MGKNPEKSGFNISQNFTSLPTAIVRRCQTTTHQIVEAQSLNARGEVGHWAHYPRVYATFSHCARKKRGEENGCAKL